MNCVIALRRIETQIFAFFEQTWLWRFIERSGQGNELRLNLFSDFFWFRVAYKFKEPAFHRLSQFQQRRLLLLNGLVGFLFGFRYISEDKAVGFFAVFDFN